MQKLRNIGPKCAAHLVKAGVDTPQKLKKIGAKKAFLQICGQSYLNCFNAAYLYALQGAIDDVDWREIPRSQKNDFKLFTAELRSSF